jgi:cation transport ATPase
MDTSSPVLPGGTLLGPLASKATMHHLQKPNATSKVEQTLQENDDEANPAQSPEPQDMPVRKPRRLQRFERSLRRSILAWILAITSLVFVSVTVWLGWRIANVQSYFDTFANYSADLKLLRVLAEVNTILLTTLTAMSSRVAIWAASSSRRGVSMSTWLAMSPATGLLGLAKLLLWHQQNGQATRDWHRLCSLIRLFLYCFETYFRILLHVAIPVISVSLTSEIR